MVEAKWGSLASVFDRFGGECLVMPVQEAVGGETKGRPWSNINHHIIIKYTGKSKCKKAPLKKWDPAWTQSMVWKKLWWWWSVSRIIIFHTSWQVFMIWRIPGISEYKLGKVSTRWNIWAKKFDNYNTFWEQLIFIPLQLFTGMKTNCNERINTEKSEYWME